MCPVRRSFASNIMRENSAKLSFWFLVTMLVIVKYVNYITTAIFDIS